MKAKKRICVVTCYRDPDYARGEVIRACVQTNPNFELISVKNNHRSILRYLEVFVKLIVARVRFRPDIYILTFRGYEVLPFVRLITIGKKLIFDEFINLIEWTVYEHKKISQNGIFSKILRKFYQFLLLTVSKILTDTKSHAEYSSRLMNIDIKKYSALPVGADENFFKVPIAANSKNSDKFEVLYYGSLLPLHGVEYVIEAMGKLSKINKNIQLTLIGGKREVQDRVNIAKKKGAKISYISKVPLKSLPGLIQKSDICLGGPFGKTLQSKMVITGKTFQFLAMGKPAIIGKTKEQTMFKDKLNCLIVDQASSEAIADKIEWSLKNKAELIKIGKNGRVLFEKEFSTKVLSNKLAEIIND